MFNSKQLEAIKQVIFLFCCVVCATGGSKFCAQVLPSDAVMVPSVDKLPFKKLFFKTSSLSDLQLFYILSELLFLASVISFSKCWCSAHSCVDTTYMDVVQFHTTSTHVLVLHELQVKVKHSMNLEKGISHYYPAHRLTISNSINQSMTPKVLQLILHKDKTSCCCNGFLW